ncbi:Endopolyphosphatase, partial [Rhizophlyctis rosea]
YYTEGSTTDHHCHPDSNGKLSSSPPLIPQSPSSDSSDSFSTTSSRRVPQLAGRFGAPGAGCDSPLALINETLRFVAERLNGLPEGMWRGYEDQRGAYMLGEGDWKKMEEERHEGLDFVVWTGDSARHDNDARFVRSESEIQALNHLAVRYMLRTFPSSFPSHPSIPIIPTIGNNDIWPHNSMTYTPTRPNPTLDYYAALWEPFMPESQRSEFRRHGSFAVEVIKDKVIVVSINTMYLSNSNDLVKDCAGREGEDGYGGDAVLKFLRQTLEGARGVGKTVHVVGHVPPNPLNYGEGCYRGFARLARDFREVVVGQHYGHMNVDHFFFPTPHDGVGEHSLSPQPPSSSPSSSNTNTTTLLSTLSVTRPDFSLQNTPVHSMVPGWFSMYFHYLMTHYHSESKRKAHEMVQPVFVAPSVVPNMNPAVRVFEYNTGSNVTDTRRDGGEVDVAEVMGGTGYVTKPGALLSYTQYYSDISKWNALHALYVSSSSAFPHPHTSSAQPRPFPPRGTYIYEREYRPLKAYRMAHGEGMGAESWREFAGR